MKKHLIIIILLVLVCGCSNTKYTKDELKFKKEYEKVNNQKQEEKTALELNISKDNNIVYKNAKEIIAILKNKTGIIYLGFPECPWCRNAVPVLIKTTKEMNYNKIYYFNALSIRDTKELDKDGNIKTTKEGTEEYYEMVDLLKDKLDTYQGLGDDSLKRIYFPTVIFVKNGKIMSLHSATVSSQKDPFKKLSTKQEKELSNIYKKGIKQIMEDTCGADKC